MVGFMRLISGYLHVLVGTINVITALVLVSRKAIKFENLDVALHTIMGFLNIILGILISIVHKMRDQRSLSPRDYVYKARILLALFVHSVFFNILCIVIILVTSPYTNIKMMRGEPSGIRTTLWSTFQIYAYVVCQAFTILLILVSISASATLNRSALTHVLPSAEKAYRLSRDLPAPDRRGYELTQMRHQGRRQYRSSGNSFVLSSPSSLDESDDDMGWTTASSFSMMNPERSIEDDPDCDSLRDFFTYDADFRSYRIRRIADANIPSKSCNLYGPWRQIRPQEGYSSPTSKYSRDGSEQRYCPHCDSTLRTDRAPSGSGVMPFTSSLPPPPPPMPVLSSPREPVISPSKLRAVPAQTGRLQSEEDLKKEAHGQLMDEIRQHYIRRNRPTTQSGLVHISAEDNTTSTISTLSSISRK